MTRRTDRREFLKSTTLVGGSLLLGGCHTFPSESEKKLPPSERLAIGIIGCGGKGYSDMHGVGKRHDIVALCDVDHKRAEKAFKEHPGVPKYDDFRVMLDREKHLDAVVVATPDHVHAVATAMAMHRGLHVYCQKPLTHSISEARALRMLARKTGVATAMGNQGTAMNGLRRAVEHVRSGTIGKVREVHCWTDRPWWPQGIGRPSKIQPVPATLRWDLWLGPARFRPYNDAYCPFKWRGWWDFGTGALGDMACHVANMAFLALELGYPTSVEAESEGSNDETGPKWSVIRYRFPARKGLPPVDFTWHDGGKKPPVELFKGEKIPTNGSLLVGDKGTMFCPDPYGRKVLLLPRERFAGFKGPEPFLPRVKNIYEEWLGACTGGRPAMSSFEYASFLTEAVLLGNLAIRAGERIEWDGPGMRATNTDKAARFVQHEYRWGYEL